MGFYQAQKIEALEARVAELEAKIYQCGLWEDMGPRQADAIVLLTTQVAQLQRSLACSIVNGNEAREQCLEHVYALSAAAQRIAGLEKELATERAVILCAPRGWHD